MLDRLIDFLLSIIGLFKFWVVVPINYRAVDIVLGKHDRRLPPGIHLQWPFEISQVSFCEVVPYTEKLDAQSLHPAGEDATGVTVTPIVTWVVVDEFRYMYGVAHGSEAILDIVAGAVGEAVQLSSSEEVFSGLACAKAYELAQGRAEEWGVEIRRIQFADAIECDTYRLVGLTAVATA